MIQKLHERALKVVLNNHISDLEVLHHKSNDICSHRRNIQMPMIELYKIKLPLNDGLQSCLNRRNVTYHSRNFQSKPERKRSVFDARLFLSHCAPKLRILMTEEINKQTNKPHKACKYVKSVLPVCEKFLN